MSVFAAPVASTQTSRDARIAPSPTVSPHRGSLAGSIDGKYLADAGSSTRGGRRGGSGCRAQTRARSCRGVRSSRCQGSRDRSHRRWPRRSARSPRRDPAASGSSTSESDRLANRRREQQALQRSARASRFIARQLPELVECEHGRSRERDLPGADGANHLGVDRRWRQSGGQADFQVAACAAADPSRWRRPLRPTLARNQSAAGSSCLSARRRSWPEPQIDRLRHVPVERQRDFLPDARGVVGRVHHFEDGAAVFAGRDRLACRRARSSMK